MDVVARAQVAPKSLSRQFRTKRELYVAVLERTEALVFGRLTTVAVAEPTLVAGVGAVFDEVLRLSRVAPSAIRFLATLSTDLCQNAQLRDVGALYQWRYQAFIQDVIEVGIASGELAIDDLLTACDTLSAMLVGLWQTAAALPAAQPSAVEGLKRLMSDSFVTRRP